MKSIKHAALIAAALSAMLLSGCKQEVSVDEGYIYGGLYTISDSGAFYCQQLGGTWSVPSYDILSYYSVETGQITPICSKPNCTHDLITSPDCAALANASGIYPAGDKLYYLAGKEDATIVVCADISNNTKTTVATVDTGDWTNIEIVRCYGDKLFFSSTEWWDREYEKETNQSKMLDKYISTVYSVDLSSGEVEEVARMQEYNLRISDLTLDGDTLVYFYSYYTAPAEEIPLGTGYENWKDYYRYGANTVNLETGETGCLTEGYERMALTHESFDYFSRDNLIFWSTDTLLLYRYDYDEKTFTPFAKCWDYERFYMADDKAALFQENEDDPVFKRYDFDSGEITEIPREGFTHIYLNGLITGEKVWFSPNYEDIFGERSEQGGQIHGYMSRDDFMNGNYTDLTYTFVR